MLPKYIKNSGKTWTPAEQKQLKELAKENTPTRVIGLKLGRPVGGVEAKAHNLKISLKPTNQAPYNRKKK